MKDKFIEREMTRFYKCGGGIFDTKEDKLCSKEVITELYKDWRANFNKMDETKTEDDLSKFITKWNDKINYFRNDIQEKLKEAREKYVNDSSYKKYIDDSGKRKRYEMSHDSVNSVITKYSKICLDSLKK